MNAGEKCKAARERHGISRAELGQLLSGASYGKIARVETGNGSLTAHESTALALLLKAEPVEDLPGLIVAKGALNAFHSVAYQLV